MPPRISSAEWEVMSVVWNADGPITSTQVFSRLPANTGWKQKTVNTFLTRLAAKGALDVQKQGNVNIYIAAVAREECVASEGESFLQRVFRGAEGSLVLHFCERADLSPEEIRKLELLLKAKKRRE